MRVTNRPGCTGLDERPGAGSLTAAALSAMLCASVFAPGSAAAATLDSAQAVMDCAAANVPEKTFALEVTLTTSDAAGDTKALLTRLYGQHKESSLQLNMKVREPANLEGTAFYVKEQPGQDDMRIYVPGLDRVRRITGSMAARELWGTSFSYQDVKQMFGSFIGGSVSFDGDSPDSARPAKRLTITPGDAEGAPFQSMRVDIDQETCVPLTASYLDADQQPLKELTASADSIKTLGAHRVATRYEMKDLISGKSTVVTFQDVEFDPRLKSSIFSGNGFHKAP